MAPSSNGVLLLSQLKESGLVINAKTNWKLFWLALERWMYKILELKPQSSSCLARLVVDLDCKYSEFILGLYYMWALSKFLTLLSWIYKDSFSLTLKHWMPFCHLTPHLLPLQLSFRFLLYFQQHHRLYSALHLLPHPHSQSWFLLHRGTILSPHFILCHTTQLNLLCPLCLQNITCHGGSRPDILFSQSSDGSLVYFIAWIKCNFKLKLRKGLHSYTHTHLD